MIERTLRLVFLTLVLGHLFFLGYHALNMHEEVFRRREIPVDRREFQIPEGSSLKDVLQRMEELDLAPAPAYMRLMLVWQQKKVLLKKGRYRLPPRASAWDMLMQFDEGRVMLRKITIPEGLDKWQTAKLLAENHEADEQAFMAWIDNPTIIQELDPLATDLEGYLFPETYHFPEEATPKEIVHVMVDHFLERTAAHREALGEMGLREWVALASMIERESSVPEERPRISGVFTNRLRRGMLLQCDPTIIYSLKLEGKYRGKIYKSDIRYPSPYNTYVSKGLPPGPIANPGLGSLDAALNPEETPYLYFVAKDDGTHHFSKNLREHNRAVRRYQR